MEVFFTGNGGGGTSSPTYLSPSFFAKPDSYSPAFIKTSANTLTIKGGTAVAVGEMLVQFPSDTAVTMPALVTGTDYAVFVNSNGTAAASASFTPPANARLIGGFHYSATPETETVASGLFAATAQAVVWNQAMVDDIKGINKYSIWDINWQPTASDPRGMAFVPELKIWVDIYLTNTSHALGTSRYGSNVASGSVLPLKPVSRGGTGISTYSRLGWWEASEIAATAGKRLLTEREFNNAAIGVTEQLSLGGTAETPPLTAFDKKFCSVNGLQQMTGVLWIWGEDHGQRDMGAAASAWAWQNVTDTRGQIYIETASSDVRVLLGGFCVNGSFSGSRCSIWRYYPWISLWNIGLRCACDHLQLG